MYLFGSNPFLDHYENQLNKFNEILALIIVYLVLIINGVSTDAYDINLVGDLVRYILYAMWIFNGMIFLVFIVKSSIKCIEKCFKKCNRRKQSRKSQLPTDSDKTATSVPSAFNTTQKSRENKASIVQIKSASILNQIQEVDNEDNDDDDDKHIDSSDKNEEVDEQQNVNVVDLIHHQSDEAGGSEPNPYHIVSSLINLPNTARSQTASARKRLYAESIQVSSIEDVIIPAPISLNQINPP